MKVLVDTNVLIDVLAAREPFFEDSRKVWQLCELRKCDGFISVLSLPNIVYILRKELNPERTIEVLEVLSSVFDCTELTLCRVQEAAGLKWKDFEDSLQYICGLSIQADFIISRNPKDFEDASIPIVTPSEFIDLNFQKLVTKC